MKNIYNIILRGFILVSLALTAVDAFAQTKVSGTVRDSKGQTVVGAAVMLEGSNTVGSVTDINGKYTLTVPSGTKEPRLKVTCIGYETVSEAVGKRAIIDFTLKDNSEELDEVVVVGYGTVRKSDLTGALSSIKIDEEKAARANTIDDFLSGHAAGVQVVSNSGAPDAAVSVRVRGLSTFSSNTEPLYVVDGVILNGSSETETMLTKGLDNSDGDEASNGLMGINPQDIESMEVLKDASATAIYGALGANGVVLITTKSAKKDRPVITFSAGVDIANRLRKADILSFNEFSEYLHDKLMMGTGSETLVYLKRMYADPYNLEGLKVQPMDWQDYTFRTAVSQKYHFSVSGRPKSFSYNFSLGYNDRQGIIKGTSSKQYTGRLNLDKKFGKTVRIGTKTSFSYVDSDLTQGTGGGRMTAATSLVRSMLSSRPSMPSKEDELLEEDEDLHTGPVRWLNKMHFIRYRKEYRVTPSLFVEWHIIPELSFKSTIGGDYKNTESQKFKSEVISRTYGTNAASGTIERLTWNWDNVFNYIKKFDGGHNLNAMAGMSMHKGLMTNQTLEGWNIPQYKGGMEALNTAPDASLTYAESENQTLSFFVRGIYNYKDRYVLTATFRADGSSRFKGARQWSYFPSAAFAWRLSEEPWFKSNVVSNTKLRLGWGRTGNQSLSNYQTLSNYTSGKIPTMDLGNLAEYTVAVYPENLANPSLKWETTEQYNAGIDFGMWQGRLSFTLDAYYKNTFDLLQQKEIPPSSGFTRMYVNEGTIVNRGIEFAVDAVPVKVGDFEMSVTGNISVNRNLIKSINASATKKSIWITPTESREVVYFEGQEAGTGSYCKVPVNIFMEGYPMGLFYGYKTAGIVGVGEQGVPFADGGEPGKTGEINYMDLNKNGYLDPEDRTIIGNPNPDFNYGFDLNLSYKRLTLGVGFVGQHGFDIFNFNNAVEYDTYHSSRNISRAAYRGAWTPEKTNTKFPALGMFRTDDMSRFSDLYVEDGSYLRLSNITLGYSIPLKNKILKNISLHASANNVWVWTKYSGWDPDVNSFGNNLMKMGVDSGSYPTSRSFSFDIKLTF